VGFRINTTISGGNVQTPFRIKNLFSVILVSYPYYFIVKKNKRRYIGGLNPSRGLHVVAGRSLYKSYPLFHRPYYNDLYILLWSAHAFCFPYHRHGMFSNIDREIIGETLVCSLKVRGINERQGICKSSPSIITIVGKDAY